MYRENDKYGRRGYVSLQSARLLVQSQAEAVQEPVRS
jgi:hypothetical protein